MGAWGVGNFENDAAMDWTYELDDAQSFDPVITALEQVTQAGDRYIDIDEANAALAAADVVAALKNAPPEDFPEALYEWVQTHPIRVKEELLNLALEAVQRVSTNSELKELWEEDEDQYPEWSAVIEGLEGRLRGTK